VRDLSERLRDYFRKLQPPESDPMLDFDEIDLLRACEDAGFRRIHLRHDVFARQATPVPWEARMNVAGNPNVPSLREIITEIFSADEAARWESCIRPQMEAGGWTERNAVAHLRARKDGGEPLPEGSED
jgi:hypothetical protein